MKDSIKHFRLTRWIMLALAVLFNSFIIVYSCLPDDATRSIARPFSNFFTQIVNTFSHREIANIPLQKIDISLSEKEVYEYNYIPGYQVDEIPLGSAKQIECSFVPLDATDKAIVYSANPSDIVSLKQNGSLVSVVGMKTGECTITAKSTNTNSTSSVLVKVVETVAPISFEISLPNAEIAIGSTSTIDIDIDGGILTHDELINFRYYNTRKLTYSSSNKDVATVDSNGVVYPKSIGTATITVSNGSYQKSLNISTVSGSVPPPYSNLSISGSSVCYDNDMIRDQKSHNNHYQLIPNDGDTELNPNDFIWESSNELLATVDRHGVLRGFRKSSLEDETLTITAKSKSTGQTATFEVTVKNKLPEYLDIYIDIGNKKIWNKKEYTVSAGETLNVVIVYDSPSLNQSTIVTSDNEDVISFTNEGNLIVLHVLKEGVCTITITSVLNPKLSFKTKYTVVKAGSITAKDGENVEYSIRKIVGHAFLFTIAQIFTYLAFFMFLHDKKWWFSLSMSLSEGLLLASLSEIIQHFVPTRTGNIVDVFIDFAGVVVGAALTMLGIFIVKKIKEKKNKKQELTK